MLTLLHQLLFLPSASFKSLIETGMSACLHINTDADHEDGHDHDHEEEDGDQHDHEEHEEEESSVDHLTWLHASLAIILISLCGIFGVVIIPIMQKLFYQHLLQFLIALGTGEVLC